VKYVCSRCGDERLFDDDIHYAVVRMCKDCGGGYYVSKQDDAKDEEEEE
jgi:uncharacterized protein (DUF983 family)